MSPRAAPRAPSTGRQSRVAQQQHVGGGVREGRLRGASRAWSGKPDLTPWGGLTSNWYLWLCRRICCRGRKPGARDPGVSGDIPCVGLLI